MEQDFARYPREADKPYGSVERLEELGAGYFGLNTGFLWMILVAVALTGLAVLNPSWGFVPFAIVYPVAAIVATLPWNKKIAAGKGWSEMAGLAASIFIGLSTIACGGIFGCIVMQQVAAHEMRKYGVKLGFSFTKKRFQYYLEQRRELDALPPAPVDLSTLFKK